MAYIPRITDIELERKLDSSGAVLVRGPKACGKTESATRLAKSVLKMDRDPQVAALMNVAPGRLLLGETLRLVDEWQVQPEIWNYIRHEVDDRKKTGQIDEAATSLHKLASVVDPGKSSAPKSLNIITGTGISYTCPDGINVISIASLGV